MMKKTLLTLVAASALTATAQNPIKVNQVGYYVNESKVAVVEPTGKSNNFILKDHNGRKVWSGKAVRTLKSPFNNKVRQVVDFSTVTKPGTYTLTAGKNKQTINIAEHPYDEALKAAIKAFYLQRTGTDIEAKYAGAFARKAAHPDTRVLIHPSAASPKRPAGTVISSPKGWYDAGDYNKYIVNSGFTIGLMLQAYQLNKEHFEQIDTQIPESNNNVPDLLDEIMYNLEWMLTMQDPDDGGVYHKLTTPNFEAFVMPVDCKQDRYVVQKSTQAALDFAATMALAARIYKDYPQYQPFCKIAANAAQRAYAWAVRFPKNYYTQQDNNSKYDPDVNTGTYDDNDADDEFFWAATEMYLTTGEQGYLEQARAFAPKQFTLPTWGNVAGLGIFQWLNQELLQTKEAGKLNTCCMKKSLKTFCDEDIKALATSPFYSIFGNNASDFIWGSNSEKCAGRGIAQMYQYALTKDNTYRKAAITTIDHIFGRNATGYCYLTGFGTQRVMHPHQRISAADGIEEPLPGFLAGGANSGQQDAKNVPAYPSSSPDESYQDHEGSYASNEIAINWNAYLVALLGFLK